MSRAEEPPSSEIYEDQEEVEITDDEAEGVDVEISDEDTPAVSVTKVPGKVTPSKQVKNMDMRSPDMVVNNKGRTLPQDKNPFISFGAWTEKTMNQIEILMPVLTGKNESTNELTRSTRPEVRYWKAPIVFKYKEFTSTTIRFDNVHIPFHDGKGYGSNFVYLCLPGFAANIFAEAGKIKRPTVVNEKSLRPDKNRWWKVANKVEESFGVINAETKKFQKKNLAVIFDATHSGITASVILSFLFKASTDSMEPLKPTTTGTISVVLERGFINATDVNVEMPVRVNNTKQKIEPVATGSDIANDSLMQRLAELGL